MWCAVCAQLKIVALGNDVAEQPEPNAAMITTQLTVCFPSSKFYLLPIEHFPNNQPRAYFVCVLQSQSL